MPLEILGRPSRTLGPALIPDDRTSVAARASSWSRVPGFRLERDDDVVERRLALGLSQVELAARAGMTQPALSRLEAGGVVPTIPLLERITAALDAELIVEIAPHAA